MFTPKDGQEQRPRGPAVKQLQDPTLLLLLLLILLLLGQRRPRPCPPLRAVEPEPRRLPVSEACPGTTTLPARRGPAATGRNVRVII